MVIEYAGEMVRPTVADQREAGSYNQLVGAGTYVFCLDDDFMVDATKAGNMAHLLNHSCQPNCYSKHVHVWDEKLGVKVPHVVICAKQAIPVREELTYDYRYAAWYIVLPLCTTVFVLSLSKVFALLTEAACVVRYSNGTKWGKRRLTIPALQQMANGYVVGHATVRQHTE